MKKKFDVCNILGVNIAAVNMEYTINYIVNNLLMRERPVLETDNMLVSLFGSNKIVSTQFFNLSFVFNIEDFLPINFIKSFISERINIYVDMYLEDKRITPYIDEFGEEAFEEKIETDWAPKMRKNVTGSENIFVALGVKADLTHYPYSMVFPLKEKIEFAESPLNSKKLSPCFSISANIWSRSVLRWFSR